MGNERQVIGGDPGEIVLRGEDAFQGKMRRDENMVQLRDEAHRAEGGNAAPEIVRDIPQA